MNMMTRTLTYAQRMAALLPATLVVCAGAAQACVIMPQSCEIAGGGEAQFNGHNGAVVLFREFSPGTERSVVVECSSRAALTITAPNSDDYSDYWDAGAIMDEAVFDDAPPTLAQVARQITRETGVATERFTLAASHCGCDLPNIPRPQSNCPVDF